jgi:hypothetical protein
MVISYENDTHPRYPSPVDAAIVLLWYRIVGWLKHQSHTTMQIQGELTRAFSLQGMGASGYQLLHMHCSHKVRQTGSQPAGARPAQRSRSGTFLLTEHSEIVIGYLDVQLA